MDANKFAMTADQDLLDALKVMSDRIGKAIKHREDIIEALHQRGLRERALLGLQVVVNAVAKEIGVIAPDCADKAPIRPRDETYFWVNIKSLAAVVTSFLEPHQLPGWKPVGGDDMSKSCACEDFPDFPCPRHGMRGPTPSPQKKSGTCPNYPELGGCTKDEGHTGPCVGEPA